MSTTYYFVSYDNEKGYGPNIFGYSNDQVDLCKKILKNKSVASDIIEKMELQEFNYYVDHPEVFLNDVMSTDWEALGIVNYEIVEETLSI